MADIVAHSIDDLIAKLIEFRKTYPTETDYSIYTVDDGIFFMGLRFQFYELSHDEKVVLFS